MIYSVSPKYFCKENTASINNPRRVIADIYDCPGGRRYIRPISTELRLCLTACMGSYTLRGENAFRRAALGSMAAAGYRLGFKGPFAPLKKQQLPLDPRFVRHEDTPTSTRTQQAL